jgi:hypothetical protein
MKKRLWLTLILATGLAFGFWLVSVNFSPSVRVQARQSQNESRGQPDEFDRINEKARAAKRGGPVEARELADAVVDPYTGNNSLINSDGTMDEVKDRLARAEVDYQQGRLDGIPEDNVVRVINGLAKKFGAPEYAKTDRSEVRTHRMALFLLTPHLTTIDRPPQGRGSKQAVGGINSKMSPLEAANVTMSLVYQKVFNEDYQKDAAEREARRRARPTAANVDSGSKAENLNQVPARTQEMLRTAQLGSIPLILPGQSKSFAHRSLDILGIPR